MKIEEIENDEGLKERKKYWLPLPKGFNRLLIVIGVIIIILISMSQRRGSEVLPALFFTLFVEIITYLAFVWVYRGFKDIPQKK